VTVLLLWVKVPEFVKFPPTEKLELELKIASSQPMADPADWEQAVELDPVPP
jgi:hypothetical protein